MVGPSAFLKLLGHIHSITRIFIFDLYDDGLYVDSLYIYIFKYITVSVVTRTYHYMILKRLTSALKILQIA